jgi:hypothetical protein
MGPPGRSSSSKVDMPGSSTSVDEDGLCEHRGEPERRRLVTSFTYGQHVVCISLSMPRSSIT